MMNGHEARLAADCQYCAPDEACAIHQETYDPDAEALADGSTPLREAVREAKAGLVQPCAWFALCDHEATGTRRHPILGDVPICDRCRVKVEALD